ncbi:tyrosine-protein phosphatase non-receptor type 2-like, partial [Tropilaelaps mercedesae]
RTFRLHDTKTGATRDVLQFHYVNWPDFGVPQSPYDFLDFLDDVRRSGCLDADVGPAVVHCSAGIGRSGTFCVVDSILKMVEENRDESDIKLQDVLIEMRRFRMSLIQTAEQLRFSYLAIIEALRRRNNRSPYLSRHNGDEDAPPRPPHRANNGGRVSNVNRTVASSSDDDDDDDDGADKNGSSPMAESSESRDSAVSSEISSADEDSDGKPPPLPPRDIPATDSLLSPEDSPSRSEHKQLQQQEQHQQQTRLGNEVGQNSETQQTSTSQAVSIKPQPNNGQGGDVPADCSEAAVSGHSEPRIIEELQRFEQEILSKETMQQASCVSTGTGEGPGAPGDGTRSNINKDEPLEKGATAEELSTELRQRRLQRDEKIKEKIQAIKKGIAEAEAAHQRRGVLGRIGIGLAVLVGTGILVYRMYNYWHS